ncbi:MAG: hypothetical protein COT85_02100 [Chlamydiae bacterium CG10_big_fil_rev_8_21_14_0_10_42_34]|nr:MAG: hypothetical protein COT85_02100 [Chlamydiae bacterium CG10_big_fil_rev_8_21_14_0_10_42_34]
MTAASIDTDLNFTKAGFKQHETITYKVLQQKRPTREELDEAKNVTELFIKKLNELNQTITENGLAKYEKIIKPLSDAALSLASSVDRALNRKQ